MDLAQALPGFRLVLNRKESPCLGSAHMGRGDLAGLAFGEVGGWGEAGKGSVWPMVVVEVLEAVEDGVEGFEGGGQVIGLVELVAPGAVAALDGSVQLWPLGRELVEGEALVLAGLLEGGLELRPAIDLEGLDGEGHL